MFIKSEGLLKMEQKLEKICKLEDLRVGLRYNLSNRGCPRYSFIVTSMCEKYINIKYLDGVAGCFFKYDYSAVWEHPFSSLELELL